MFVKDTKIVYPPAGNPTTSRSSSFVCDPDELLTGFTARFETKDGYNVINTINSPICTNFVTGEVRKVNDGNAWAGWNNAGNIVNLQCPAGSYISSIKSNWRGWDNNDKVTSNIGFACKSFDKAQKIVSHQQAGKDTVYGGDCPSGYYINRLDFTSGKVLNTTTGTCINMNPRINVISGSGATDACCMGTGDAIICGEYTPQSGHCDKYFLGKCKANPAAASCACFSVPEGVPPCYASKCLNGGYMTKNMKDSCPTQYINCDAQVAAANSGTQLSANYTLQQNCGGSPPKTPLPSGGTTGGSTAPGTTASTVTTTGNAPVASAINTNYLIYIFIFLVLVAVFVTFYSGKKMNLFSDNISLK
jgi:hypothetical protein